MFIGSKLLFDAFVVLYVIESSNFVSPTRNTRKDIAKSLENL